MSHDEPRRVAVLFVRKRSAYHNIAGVDLFDKSRDARTFAGSMPVVAHPPCRAWASLRHHAKPEAGERELAFFAIAAVRSFGGVLEHPLASGLWRDGLLPAPGCVDEYGGWSTVINQWDFGHRAKKSTRLYICGIDAANLPAPHLRLGIPTHTIGLWSGRDKTTAKPSCNKSEYESTPPALAQYLVEVARATRAPGFVTLERVASRKSPRGNRLEEII